MLQSALLISILFINLTWARPASVWTINIFKGPAPPPDQGPPLSAGALRDKSKLKYEVIGIAGAYLLWISVSLVLIIFVGKKLRRRAQSSNRTLSMEILKSPRTLVGHSTQSSLDIHSRNPRSPTKISSWKSWGSSGKGHSHKHSNLSMSTVDERQLEMDKARNMDEMTKLYAAVMAHDEEKSQVARSSTQTFPQSPQYINPMTFPTPPMSPQQPPEFQHLRDPLKSPILPRGQPLSHPLAPTPVEEDFPSTQHFRTGSHKTNASPMSFTSTVRTDSAGSHKHRPSRISIRDLPISPPIASADLEKSSREAVDGPMSPRNYTPGRPPPTPSQISTAPPLREIINGPTSPRNYPLGHLPPTPSQTSTAPPVREVMDGPISPRYYALGHLPPTPRQTSTNPPLREVERKTPSVSTSLKSTAAGSSTNNLPFRQYYNESLRSAPPTKTTFLDRRDLNLGTHPQTGIPPTPYSAYMPYTPMTPVTPRKLMTRMEMKKNKKKEGLKVLNEDDMVKGEEDMWGEVN